MVFVTVSKGITSKLDNPELRFLHSECRLMIVNTGMKFHEDTLNFLSYRVDTIEDYEDYEYEDI